MNMSMKRPFIGMANKRKYKCCICNIKFYDYGHNPYPISNIGLEERCCDKCNKSYVIAARLALRDNKISLEQLGLTWKAKEFLKRFSNEKFEY